MKKQQKTYILLAASCIVWGVIGFQIYRYLNPTSESEIIANIQKYVPEKAAEKEIYFVNKHERDPFLDTYKKTTTTKKKTKAKSSKKIKRSTFPKVSYNGIVFHKKKQSFIVTINNNQQILKVGDVFKNVTLIAGNSNEIKVKHDDEIKVITK